MSQITASVDAIVVGGGLTGLAAAVAVARTGRRTVHLSPPAPPDRRTSALMGPSVAYLREAGLIDAPETIGNPLRCIRIIDATGRLIRAPETLFDSADAGLAEFGWNFSNFKLATAFTQAASRLPNLETRFTTCSGLVHQSGIWVANTADGGSVQAQLIIGADGKKSSIRTAAGIAVHEHSFAQMALVCDLTLARPLNDTSVEFHYPQGPFTLVPAGGNRANLVWIDEPETLNAAKTSSPEALARLLREKAQHLFGAMAIESPVAVFPLSTLTVDQAGKAGVILVGEAAHAFPPIGAQGLNLGLRDVADLSASLAQAGDQTASEISARYAQLRAGDLARTTGMVDALFRSLLVELLPAQALRASGLWALRAMPQLRRHAFSLGMGQR